MESMDECIFCKIVKGDIPSYKVYEDQHALAILNINPVTEGHTLVIPKTHSQNIFDVDKESLQHLILVVQKVSQQLKNRLGVEGINIGMNNGTPGQEIFHLHVHLMPRREGDGLVLWDGKKASSEELQRIAEKINRH